MQPGILRGGLGLSFCFKQMWREALSWRSSQPWVGFRGEVRGVCWGALSSPVCPLSQHAMPFWRVSSHSDLMALHHALELEYLWPPHSTLKPHSCPVTRDTSCRPESRISARLVTYRSRHTDAQLPSVSTSALVVHEGPRLFLQNSCCL